MKKAISLILALLLCLSLCACGNKVSNGRTFTVEELKAAFAENSTLEDIQPNFETSGDNVTSFSYVVEDVNAEDLVNKQYVRNALSILNTDSGKLTGNHLNVLNAFISVVAIELLFTTETDSEESYDEFEEKVLEVICDGKTIEIDGWNVSAKIDKGSDTMTVTAVSK